MPPAKKRKVTTTEKRKLPFPKQQQPGIQSFGRISKPQALPDIPSTKKGSEIVTVPVLKLEKEQVWSNGNKRKFETIEEESDVKEGLVEKKDLPVLRELKAKASDAVCQSVLVDSALQARAVEGKPTSDDHAGSHIGLDQLPRSSLPPTTPSPLPCQTGATPIDTPVASNKDEESDDPSQTLPEELQDMINLHSAFLTALSLHYAHNGSLTPADLRLLSPSIERAWGKRKVNLDDIRRLLGVLDIPATGGSRSLALPSRSAFRLSNYGGGKVCVEMRECSQKRGIMASHIDEDKLNTQFTSRLRYCWLHRKGLSSEDGNQEKKSAASEEPVGQSTYIPTYAELINTNSVAEFISKLPLAPIPICSSLSKISPTLSKGQLRLSDLKASAIKGKENSLKRQAIPSTSPSPKTTKDRGQGLMERVSATQQTTTHKERSFITYNFVLTILTRYAQRNSTNRPSHYRHRNQHSTAPPPSSV